jgi:hypothetical protein
MAVFSASVTASASTLVWRKWRIAVRDTKGR